MNKMKRFLAGILCLVLLFSLTGCGSEESASDEQTGKDYVYTAEYKELEGDDFPSNILTRGSVMYYATSYYNEEEGTSGQRICSVDLNTLEKTTLMDVPEGGSVYAMTILDDGGVAMILSTYNMDSNTQSYELVTMDSAGTETLRQDITAALSEGDNSEYGVYPQSMEADSEGNIYVLVSGMTESIMIFDPQGQRQANIQSDSWYQALCKSGDGRVFALGYDSSGDGNSYQLTHVDPAAKAMGDAFGGVPSGNGNIYSTPGGDNEILLSSGDNLYSYDLSTSSCNEILNWIDCDIDSMNLQGIARLEDGRILAVNYNFSEASSSTELVYLTETPASEAVQKTILTYGTMYLDSSVREKIIDFNKTNDTYRIEVKEYGLSDSSGQTQLDSDIVSGNAPDIIDLNNSNVDNYIAKGVLTDLYPLMDNDPSMNRDDFLENVLTAMEQDGKLYGVIPSFSIQTLMGRVSDLGDRTSWTVKDVAEILASKPEGTSFSDYTSREYLLQMLLMLDLDTYIDWSTGTCSFDSQDFIDVLEFVNTFPSVEELNYDDSYDPYAKLADGTQLVTDLYLSDVQSYPSTAAMFGGAEVRCIGYPTAHGTGVILNTSMAMGISESCEHKDGAWAFVSSLLSEEFQDNLNWQFPIRESSLDKQIAKEMDPETYTSGGMSYGNSFSYDYQPLTEEQAAAIKEVISMAEPTGSYNTEIFSIISEEASPYFAGQKSAADAAKIIQSRVEIYVSENS